MKYRLDDIHDVGLLGRAASKEGAEKEEEEIRKARAACEKQLAGKEVAEGGVGCVVALPDDEGVQTRLNPVPTISLVLARERRRGQVVLLNGDVVRLEGEQFSISIARALHRNLVQVPKRRAFAAFQAAEETARYVPGEQTLGTVDNAGVVSVPGLRADVRIRWDRDYGLEIRREMGEEDDEPGD